MPNATAQQPPLTIENYAEAISQTNRFAKSPDGLTKLTYGFFGEIGGLLAALKKVDRDRLLESETEVAAEEIGDALWYLLAIAKAQKIDPQVLGRCCIDALRTRFKECDHVGQGSIGFRQIDGIIDVHGSSEYIHRDHLLGELALLSGEAVERQNNSQPIKVNSSPADFLGQLLSYLALVSASFLLKLEDVARDNLVKIHSRWPGQDRAYVPAFDASFEGYEQLPRELSIEFIERTDRGGIYVWQSLHGVNIGDRLTDNSVEPDDYRFHDVFHLAYVAHLGWSPVIRALLKVKRKSKYEIDENQDGARAIIIEEGIATWIFNHAKKRSFYEDVEPGKLDYGLLKQVHSMVRGFEVDVCPLWQWETAILEGFRIFRELRKPEHRGGTVTVNMIDHTIEYKAPTGEKT